MSAMKARPYHRRQWIVNRKLQFRFIRAIVLFLFLVLLATFAAIYAALWSTLYTFELLQDPVTVSIFTVAGWLLALELLLLTPIMIWIGIRLTHKVAGPLVRIRAALAQLTAGHADLHLTLRKGDELLELAEDINRLAASLRARKA